jgi:2-amino-4-hydroxy-6-hydroxymethyldihydropteridine diphosphokinase
MRWAIEQLRSKLIRARASSLIETDPVDVPDSQPPYLNGVVVGETPLKPREVLTWLLDLEQQRGRRRPSRRAPRTLDLDLILHGDVVINEADLVIPHPRFRERAFVLGPLAEIAPEIIDPATGQTIGALHARLA